MKDKNELDQIKITINNNNEKKIYHNQKEVDKSILIIQKFIRRKYLKKLKINCFKKINFNFFSEGQFFFLIHSSREPSVRSERSWKQPGSMPNYLRSTPVDRDSIRKDSQPDNVKKTVDELR